MRKTSGRAKTAFGVAVSTLIAFIATMLAWALPAQAASTWYTASVNQGSCEVRVPTVTVVSTADSAGFGYRIDGTNHWVLSSPEGELAPGTHSFDLPEVAEGQSVTFQVIGQYADPGGDVAPTYPDETLTFSVPECTEPGPTPDPEPTTPDPTPTDEPTTPDPEPTDEPTTPEPEPTTPGPTPTAEPTSTPTPTTTAPATKNGHKVPTKVQTDGGFNAPLMALGLIAAMGAGLALFRRITTN